jgi:multidrug resistance protein, MATE family
VSEHPVEPPIKPATEPMSRGAAWRQIAANAWPITVGQIAVVGFATIDTALVARYATTDLAALSVGMAAYIVIFVGFMGVVMAVGPIVAQAFGAGRHEDAGHAVHQGAWIALVCAAIGVVALLFPQPFLWLSKAPPEIASKVQGYLTALAFALPAALLFTVYRSFNTSVSRPKAVMALQVGGLMLKIPLSALLIHGWGSLPALGVTGCGVATALVMWLQCVLAWWVLRRDAFYAPFALHHKGEWLRAPNRARMTDLLKLGVPMGLGIGLEVIGFAAMAFFISRLGMLPVAGHQIAVNLVSLMFMVPLGLSNAAGALVGQQVGAGRFDAARRLGWHGMSLATAAALVLAVLIYGSREGIVALYTDKPEVAAAVLPLLGWLVLFHVVDAVQTMAGFVLRAWRAATLPMVIYAVSLIGVGLGGGWWLVFSSHAARMPQALQGAKGYWFASTMGLTCAAVLLTLLMAFGSTAKRQPLTPAAR